MRNAANPYRLALSSVYRLAAGAAVLGLLSVFAVAEAADESEKKGVKPAGTSEGSQGESREHPLAPALKLARESQKALADVKDYEATFNKRELVGRQMIAHDMHLKHRVDPFSVYLKFLRTHQGREVLYVANQNNGKLLAREASGIRSLVGTLELIPTSPEAMAEGRHPITEIGMHHMLDAVIQQWEEESKFGETSVEYFPEAKLGNVECLAIRSTHPRPRRQFKFHQTVLYIDKKTNYPVRLEQYGFPARDGDPAPIIEEYTYTGIRTNLGLTDHDFDPRNKNYRFR